MTGCFTVTGAFLLFMTGFVIFGISQLCELGMYILGELAGML